MELGWIDFSRTERNKILNVMTLLSERGTVDELGFGPVRDGFSNLFFPGTSTGQTRAKYFLTVPYMCKEAEKKENLNVYEFLGLVKDLEISFGIQALIKKHNETGIIGKNAIINSRHNIAAYVSENKISKLKKDKNDDIEGRTAFSSSVGKYKIDWNKRGAISLYWSGLKRYGIFLAPDLSESQYAKQIANIKFNKKSAKLLGSNNDRKKDDISGDDLDAGDDFNFDFWNSYLPYKKDWLKNSSVKLNEDEAYFLKDRIKETCKETMLAYVLENNITEFVSDDINNFNDIEGIINLFPEDMQDDYSLAKSFSEFRFFIITVYNSIVYNHENLSVEVSLNDQLDDIERISNIDIDAVFGRLGITNRYSLKIFLKKCKELMIKRDIETLEKLIIQREKDLKGESRAKTVQGTHEDADKWDSNGYFDYRFRIAKTIVKDIMLGEGIIDA